MRAALLLLAAVAVAGVVWVLHGKRVETYSDSYVRAGEIERPFDYLLVHVSKQQYMVINGKTYAGVRGMKPFYLRIPELKALLFVTEGSEYGETFHIINLQSKKEIEIDGGTAGFGRDIGSGRKPGEPFSDYIESVASNKVTIATRSLDWKETWLLNLDSKRIERAETFDYDQSGNVTNHSVYVNGERVK